MVKYFLLAFVSLLVAVAACNVPISDGSMAILLVAVLVLGISFIKMFDAVTGGEEE